MLLWTELRTQNSEDLPTIVSSDRDLKEGSLFPPRAGSVLGKTKSTYVSPYCPHDVICSC